MENNHTDHVHRQGTSSMEDNPFVSNSLQEPPANSTAKLDLEAQLDSDVKKIWEKQTETKVDEVNQAAELKMGFQNQVTSLCR